MKNTKKWLLITLISFCFNNIYSQQSKYLHTLVDSIPNGTPVLVNFKMKEGFMATERISISKNGKALYYGVRNGYDTTSTAEILKIKFNKNKWSKSHVVFADSSGAPSLSRDEKTMYFQYDHPKSPKGLYSLKTEDGWSVPKRFLGSVEKTHYLQSPKKNSYYYSAGIEGNAKVQDIFHVVTTKSDTIQKGLGFNIKGDWIDFYVAPDESFLVLLINKKNNDEAYKFYSNADLFISFKKNDNKWSTPVSLGKEVHSVSDWNWGPYVTNDKKYLFFSSWGKTVGTYMIDFEPIYNRLKTASD